MKVSLARAAMALVGAACVFGSAPAAAQNSLTFQGVTFQTVALDADTLQLTITNALSGGTGDWTDIVSLAAFEIKDIGDITGGQVVGGPGTWTNSDNSLSANGCVMGQTNGGCFTANAAVALTDSMTWTIDWTGSPDFLAPHLKVEFLNAQGGKQGSLLSMTIPAIPEPHTYALMLAGIGAIGFLAVRRRLG